MPADLQFWHPDHLADAKGKLLYRAVNTLNTPISGTPTWLDNGMAICDVYELVFTDTGGTVTATRDALIGGTKNPYRDMTGVPVTADGTTVNETLVPGIGIIVSASVATGWKARVAVMNYLEDDGSYVAFFGYGVITAGAASTGQRVAVKNAGAADATSCVVYSLPGFYFGGTSAEAFVEKISPHTSPTRHKLADAGTYAITFADWKTGGSGKKTADVYVDGVKAIEDAEFDGATVYQHGVSGYDDAADKLKGLAITLADTTADPSAVTVTLYVTDDYTWTEYAPDVSGSPGTYANQDLTLTETGEPSGTITTGGAAYFWHQWNLPDAALAGDLRKGVPRLRGLTV